MFYGCIKAKLLNILKNETAANEGEVGGGGDKNVRGADKNGMSNFIFSPRPTFYFARPPLKSEWMNAYVVTLRD